MIEVSSYDYNIILFIIVAWVIKNKTFDFLPQFFDLFVTRYVSLHMNFCRKITLCGLSMRIENVQVCATDLTQINLSVKYALLYSNIGQKSWLLKRLKVRIYNWIARQN